MTKTMMSKDLVNTRRTSKGRENKSEQMKNRDVKSRDVETFAEKSGLRRDGDQADRRYGVSLIIENRGWVG